ncbi:MAG: hypothetical protein OYH76_13175 [Defluviicoccus sp.]|nr:hypothetical protein [Defluviicoccus sp.]MDE0276840.1 hypothetical protein [Defluviicoccus sp.]
MTHVLVVDDEEASVEFDGVAVVVASPASLVPALRQVEGLVDAAGDLEHLSRVGGLHRCPRGAWCG